jgi:hypothetical protein
MRKIHEAERNKKTQTFDIECNNASIDCAGVKQMINRYVGELSLCDFQG